MFLFDENKNENSSYADYIPYYLMVNPHTVLNKNMFLMSCFQYVGFDLDLLSIEDQTIIASRINNVIRAIPENFGLHFDSCRIRITGIPRGTFKQPIAQEFEDLRLAELERQPHYQTLKYISIWYQPQSEKKIVNKFLFGENDEKKALEKEIDYFCNQFERIAAEFSMAFESVEILENENLLTYLHYTTSLKQQPVSVPSNPIDLDVLLNSVEINTDYPIQIGDKYVLNCSLNDFPMESKMSIFREIESLPFEVRMVSRFIPYSKSEALSFVKKKRKIYLGKQKGLGAMLAEKMGGDVTLNTEEVANYEATEEVLGLMGNDTTRFGHLTTTFHVFGENFEDVQNNFKLLQKTITAAGFTAKEEYFYAFQAWLSAMPGSYSANKRKAFLSGINLSHIVSAHSSWLGNYTNDHLAEITGCQQPHMVCVSTDLSTFYLNLNVGDVGHTFICGGTGSGKSTLLTALEIQWLRYPKSQVVIFDIDRSSYNLTRKVGGLYYEPAMDEDEAEGYIQFQPLNITTDEVELSYAYNWIKDLLAVNNYRPTAQEEKEIHAALQTFSRIARPELKTISGLEALIQVQSIKDILKKYTKKGQYGYIFDGNKDTMKDSFWLMIEMRKVLAKKDDVIIPVLNYLFFQIDRKLKVGGDPTLIIIDEAWSFFKNPIFSAKISDWLKTLRKKNAYVVICTQEINDVSRNADMEAVVLNSCLTKIYLANNQAEELADSYRRFGLNDDEIATIDRMTPKREYLFKNEYGTRIFSMGLTREMLGIIRGE